MPFDKHRLHQKRREYFNRLLKLDQGLITQEEYEAKRKELLSKI
ncbi:MAG: SHOCT domain-containing protein [Ruminococcus sp.]